MDLSLLRLSIGVNGCHFLFIFLFLSFLLGQETHQKSENGNEENQA